MPSPEPTMPSTWDSSKYYIAVGLMVTYFPVAIVVLVFFDEAALFSVVLLYGIASLMLRCSRCSWPLFKRGRWWVPWTWRSCPQCSHPLIVAPHAKSNATQPDAGTPPNNSLERTRDR
jgi:hypothetical protein